jgi:hypothetical protein
MDRKKLLQVLLPAAAAGGMVLLVGLLIALGDGGSSAPTTKGADGKPVAAGGDDSGMSDSIPPLDAPEWKDQGNGLKVWDVKEGEGIPVPPGGKVLAHYTGWLTDGTVFDSSRNRGAPSPFGLNGVIKGWTLGLPGMKPGGIRRLYIPADLAYGSAGRPGIPPDAPLVFEVKLINAK